MPPSTFLLLLQLFFFALPGCRPTERKLEVIMVCYHYPNSTSSVLELLLKYNLSLSYNSDKNEIYEDTFNSHVSSKCNQPKHNDASAIFPLSDKVKLAKFSIYISGNGVSDAVRVNLSSIFNARSQSFKRIKGRNFTVLNVTSHQHPLRHFVLWISLRCPANYYGPDCNISCVPNERYTCQPSGARLCRAGWSGPKCDGRDYCLDPKPPCMAWVKCRSLDSGTFCICDGSEGPECLVEINPCFNHRCGADSYCVPVNDRATCVQTTTIPMTSLSPATTPSSSAWSAPPWVFLLNGIALGAIAIGAAGGSAIVCWRHRRRSSPLSRIVAARPVSGHVYNEVDSEAVYDQVYCRYSEIGTPYCIEMDESCDKIIGSSDV